MPFTLRNLALEEAFSDLSLYCRLVNGTRSARGTEPHTHRLWSTSFRLVVT